MKKIFLLISLLINLTVFGQKQNNKLNILEKPTLEFQEQNVINFEKFIIANKVPIGDGIETKYDDKQYRLIVWKGGSSNNIFNFSVENMALINYEYIKVSISDARHKVYVYRNCSKNLVFEVTEWFYEKRISLSLQWYDSSIKSQIGYLMYCDLFKGYSSEKTENQNIPAINKDVIYKKSSLADSKKINVENANTLIKKVGTFPENYIGKQVVFDKIYSWFRLEPSPLDNNNERFYKVTLCDLSSDCFSALGIKTAIVIPIVRKNIAEKLMNDKMSGDDYKYISRITGTVIKKKLGKFDYVILISKVEIYDESKSVVLDTYQ